MGLSAFCRLPCKRFCAFSANNGFFVHFLDLHGKKHDLNGVFPDTRRELPRFIPRVNTSKDSKFIFEEPFLEENYNEEEY
jgi:hypothetical protein